MISFINGKLVTKNPAFVVMDCGGIGYHINITLNTYEKISKWDSGKLYTHLSIREDAHTLYGFFDEAERNLFVLLISVSGVGPSTGRVMLSSIQPKDFVQAILHEDEALIRSIKGIGPKTAKRLILELTDKLEKNQDIYLDSTISHNTQHSEALSALSTLGFSKSDAEKTIRRVLKDHGNQLPIEELIKLCLRAL